MPSSTTKSFSKGNWELIVSNVTGGNIGKVDDTPIYFYTFVPTGEDPPPESKKGLPWKSRILEVRSTSGEIDVYIKATNLKGEVEVML